MSCRNRRSSPVVDRADRFEYVSGVRTSSTKLRMVQRPSFRKTSSAEYLAKLDSACQWLSVESGRAARYGQIIREFLEKEVRSREHILAYGESCEIVDVFQLWEQRITGFPGFEKKIKGRPLAGGLCYAKMRNPQHRAIGPGTMRSVTSSPGCF